MKRQLILFHRWLGVVLCGVFVLWFLSGGVMMYVDFPKLTAEERFAGIEPLALDDFKTSPAAAWQKTGIDGVPDQVRMSMVSGRPAWHLYDLERRQWVSAFADEAGGIITPVSNEQAVKIAAEFARNSGFEEIAPSHLGLIHGDQWTVYSANNPFRPLHKISVGDRSDTVYYVSEKTGEVIRDTHRVERAWNWVGAVLHWIYFEPLRKHTTLWANVCIFLALLGTILAISGIVVGIVRYRFRKSRPDQSRIPHKGALRWHFITGIGFGIPLVTWVFSGLVSMNPWDLFTSSRPALEDRLVMRGGSLLVEQARAPFELADALPRDFKPKEGELIQLAGVPHYVFFASPDESFLVRADETGAKPFELFDESEFLALAKQLMPGHEPAQTAFFSRQDAYHYSHRPNDDPVRVPFLRVDYADEENTSLYFDPHTGMLLHRYTTAARWHRWLYYGLHSFDFPGLTRNRPLWDIVVLVPLTGGLAISMFGMIVGWRRIRSSGARRKALKAKKLAKPSVSEPILK